MNVTAGNIAGSFSNCSVSPAARIRQRFAKSRFTLFPVYFQQRSPETNENYTALVPFYGHLKNRLFRDEIFFVMFPIYSETQETDVVTDNYLYPFFDLRHGDGLHGWQFWPLVGNEHKDVTTQTNGFGDMEIIGGHDHYFCSLADLLLKQNNGIGTDNPEKFRALICRFTATSRSPKRDSTPCSGRSSAGLMIVKRNITNGRGRGRL